MPCLRSLAHQTERLEGRVASQVGADAVHVDFVAALLLFEELQSELVSGGDARLLRDGGAVLRVKLAQRLTDEARLLR